MGEKASRKKQEQWSSSSVTIHSDYAVYMSNRLMIVVILSSVALAFVLGRCSRVFVQDTRNVMFGPQPKALMELAREKTSLPVLLPAGEEKVPATRYTSKQLDAGAAIRSNSILIDKAEDLAKDDCMVDSNGAQECAAIDASGQPSGQQLLVDIANVDASFLDSVERLAHAMVNLARESGLALLSYHCYKLEPTGVSCAGILLKSHVTFHTWPTRGVITLDLFTSKTEPLIPLLPSIERLFGIPLSLGKGIEEEEKATVKWTYKKRGFKLGQERVNAEEIDFFGYLLGTQRFEKTPVTSIQTEFQCIDVYDVIDIRSQSRESHRRSLVAEGSYESMDPELYQVDRVVYLDHIMQSRRYGEAAYHESLVHPAMFTHENPKRVAIIGGGEGATLREVLKHKTVEKAVMIEIDEEMVDVSRKYMPEWSNCSNIVGSAESCFDDSRAEIFYEDAIAWFIDRFLDKADFDSEDGFDVIIMDALDPSSVVEFSDILYDNQDLMEALSNALDEDGILVAQMGEANSIYEPPLDLEKSASYAHFLSGLKETGFESVVKYDDFHGRFNAPWSYLLAMKGSDSRSKWFANEAEITLASSQRLSETRNNGQGSLLRYFDGATMASFQFPFRNEEEQWCRQDPKPDSCTGGHGFDPEVPNVPASSLYIKPSKAGPNAGRGVFTKENIPKGAYVALEELGYRIFVPSTSFALLVEGLKFGHDFFFTFVRGYVDGYGWLSSFHGEQSALVDPAK